MKVWIIVIKATDDEAADGVTDELCAGAVYRRLDQAKRECSKILDNDYGQSEIPEESRGFTDEIEWAEITRKGEARRFLGRPRANVDETFELHQAEVV